MAMSESEREELLFTLGQKFTPGTPINKEGLFSGRRSQTLEVVDAINLNGQHVILYGERGVGKTSLANMIAYKLNCPGYYVMTPHINCTSAKTSDDIWRAVLDDISFRADRSEIVLPKTVSRVISDFDNGARVEMPPELARRVLTDLADEMFVVVIIDEFDAVESNETRQTVAQTIKYFSDRNVPSTIVIVGIADDLTDLIAEHESIERCVAQVRMPRMSRDEIEGIIVSILEATGMTIDPDALHEISRLSKGLPHYAHLLGLHAGRCALMDGSKTIRQVHVTGAINTAIDKAKLTIRQAYSAGTTSTKKNALYKEVLLACAMAETDELGLFAPTDVREPLERILRRPYGMESFARHLNAFCQPDRGPILRKFDIPYRPKYRFENALMQPFVILKGLNDGIISEDDLRNTRDPNDPQGRLF